MLCFRIKLIVFQKNKHIDLNKCFNYELIYLFSEINPGNQLYSSFLQKPVFLQPKQFQRSNSVEPGIKRRRIQFYIGI